MVSRNPGKYKEMFNSDAEVVETRKSNVTNISWVIGCVC